MDAISIIFKLVEHKGEIASAVASISAGVVSLCALASVILPPATVPGFYADFRKIINAVGQNYGHAKNIK
jgi:hypothetical protein